jgi:hypothetical protein
MRQLQLSISSITTNGGVHTSLVIDGHDTGVLYLNSEERDLLNNVLREGAKNSPGVTFCEVAPEEEFDYDIFDD